MIYLCTTRLLHWHLLCLSLFFFLVFQKSFMLSLVSFCFLSAKVVYVLFFRSFFFSRGMICKHTLSTHRTSWTVIASNMSENARRAKAVPAHQRRHLILAIQFVFINAYGTLDCKTSVLRIL